jgi:prolyl-tRNA editing enzyme YbaK/EbsC (Cys-tRNA(Pro) deacylase)
MEGVVAAGEVVELEAIGAFLSALDGLAHTVREHEPARHARHLASIWSVSLPEAGRATLFDAGGRPVLVLVPADRKVAAPRLRQLLDVEELRVLRGDRGVGRIGWRGLPGEPGALPAVPAVFRAGILVERLVLAQPRLVVAVAPGCSVSLSPADDLRVTGAETVSLAGRTRLLPGGGMVVE